MILQVLADSVRSVVGNGISGMKKDVWDEFVKAIATNPQGMLLFLVFSLWITIIQILHWKEVIHGYKGANKRMEPPEWNMYIFSWYAPYILIGSACQVMHPWIEVWYFMGVQLVYGLTGNKGVEAIIAWKTGQSPNSEPPKEGQQ